MYLYIIKNKTDLVSPGIFSIQILKKSNLISAVVGIIYHWNHFTCLEVYSSKQRYRTKPFILIITLYSAMVLVWEQILPGGCNGLDPGFSS